MSDLISRSQLYDQLANKLTWLMRYGDDVYLAVGSDVRDVIYNMPTAYSVDKVVEQFEEIRAKKTCNKEKCDTKELCRICVVDDAIEIVKQGGVSDDVCEWQSVSNGEFIQNPHTKRLYSNEPSMRNVYCKGDKQCKMERLTKKMAEQSGAIQIWKWLWKRL